MAGAAAAHLPSAHHRRRFVRRFIGPDVLHGRLETGIDAPGRGDRKPASQENKAARRLVHRSAVVSEIRRLIIRVAMVG